MKAQSRPWLAVAALCCGPAALAQDPSAIDEPAAHFATPSTATAIETASPTPAPLSPAPPATPSPQLTRSETATRTIPLKTPKWNIGTWAPLALVLGLIVAVALILRLVRSRTTERRPGPLQIIQRTALSPKQSLALVRAGRRVVLVGVTPERITLLTEILDSEECVWLTSSAEPGRREDEFEDVLGTEASAYTREPLESSHSPAAGGRQIGQARESVRQLIEKLSARRGGASPPEAAS